MLKAKVVNLLQEDSNVESILYSLGNEDTFFVIISHDDPEIELSIFNRYWILRDELPELNFEFVIYSIVDFNKNFDFRDFEKIY